MSYLGFMIFWGISLRIFLGTGTLLKICFSDLFFLSVEPSIFFHFFLTLSPSPFWLILFFQKICLIYLISIITLVFIFLQDCPRPPKNLKTTSPPYFDLITNSTKTSHSQNSPNSETHTEHFWLFPKYQLFQISKIGLFLFRRNCTNPIFVLFFAIFHCVF